MAAPDKGAAGLRAEVARLPGPLAPRAAWVALKSIGLLLPVCAATTTRMPEKGAPAPGNGDERRTVLVMAEGAAR